MHQQLESVSHDTDYGEGTIVKAIVRTVVLPGAMITGAFGVSYALMFSQVLYEILALLLGVGFGSQRLDPAVLLECLENEDTERDKDQAERFFA